MNNLSRDQKQRMNNPSRDQKQKRMENSPGRNQGDHGSARSEEMLRSGAYLQLACHLCIPTILIMLVNVLYHMADVFFIGQTKSPHMVAAVTLAGPMFSILSGLGVLLGNGGCTAMSLALGRGEYEKVKQTSAFAIYASLFLGLLFSGMVLPLLHPICQLLGTDEETLSYTADYLRIIAAGAPVIMLTNVIPSLIRADGSTTSSMIGNMIGTALNIVLDPLLILHLQMGVSGAALATLIGNIGGLIYYLYFLFTRGKLYSLSPRDISLRGGLPFTVIRLGLPMSCATILMSISSAISNHLMMSYGSIAIAAQSVAGRIGMIISMTVMGICMGMQPAISYNYGSKNYRRLIEILWKTTALSVVAGSLLSLFCLLARDSLLRSFLDRSEVLSIGRICMLASILVGPFLGFYQMCTTYLQATGKSNEALLVSLLEKGLFYIPVLFLMRWLYQMYGIVFASTVTTVLSAMVALYFCYRDFRRELGKKKEANA